MIKSKSLPAANSSTYLLLIAIILIWAFSWPTIKIGINYMPALWFVVMRLLIGVVGAFVIVLARKQLCWPSRHDWVFILLIGIFQMGIFVSLISVGLQFVPPGRAAILAYTTPLWVTPIAVWFFHEKLNFLKIVGLLLGIAGMVVLFNPLSFNWHNNDYVLGNLLLILSAMSWAVAILATRYYRTICSPLQLLPWQLLVGSILVIPVAQLFESHPIIHWNLALTGSILYNGILSTAVGFWGAIRVGRSLPATTISLAFLGVPVCGLLTSAWILHEPITIDVISALFLIIAGILCMIISTRYY